MFTWNHCTLNTYSSKLWPWKCRSSLWLIFCSPHETKSYRVTTIQSFYGRWRAVSCLDFSKFIYRGFEFDWQAWHQSETQYSFQQTRTTSDQTLLYQHLRNENKKLCHIGRKVLCFAVPELFHFRSKYSSFYFKNIQEFVCKLHGNLVHFSEPKSSHLR